LNGAACKLEAELLRKALMQHSTNRCFATCYKDLKEPTTFLYFNCQNFFLKSKTLEEKLYSVEQQIDSKLRLLMTPETNSSSIELPSTSTGILNTPTRKRSVSASSSVHSSPDVSVRAYV